MILRSCTYFFVITLILSDLATGKPRLSFLLILIPVRILNTQKKAEEKLNEKRKEIVPSF